MKLLIDTGSTKSFINPKIAHENYPNQILLEPFTVSTVFQSETHQHCADIPIFPEFKQNVNLKFYLFKFHNIFDGLIGLDNLKLLNAQIDLINSKLITPVTTIPIKYQPSQVNQIFKLRINPHTQVIANVPVKQNNGDVLVPHQIIQKCEIPATLSKAQNGFAKIQISNKTDEDIIMNLTQPINSFPFIESNYEFYHLDSQKTGNTKFNAEKLIRTSHMNEEEKSHILKLCNKYSDIFHIEGQRLTFTNQIKHSIKTKDEIPIYTRSYRYPFVHKDEVRRQINSMLEQGIIRPSNSPWSSPIWIVPKKNDSSLKKKFRIVVDFRKLNEKSIDDKYPLPNITDVLDKLGKCNYFSTIDLASGYHQIEMNPDDIPKTAFSVENGHYEYLRMPFGLKSASATFQRVMDNMLRGLQNEICLVYLDDIIVYSTSLQEHIVNLEKVFQRLRETNFKIQLDKSEFLRKEVAYLGHIVTPDGVKPNPDKIKAIKKYPIPRTPKEIKGFLGLLGYYRKFIKDFAKITKPLTQCLKKGSKIEHTPQFIECFEYCKNLLTNDPILQYPDFEKEFLLTTDASNVAIGAVLSQGPIGSDRPVAYASRTLNDSERNYSTIERELLAIVWATKYFRPYLFGRKFKILSDHRPLQWVMSLKEPNSKLLRWRLKLSEFQFEILYKKGSSNSNADALSRVELHNKELFEYMQKFNESFSKSNDNDKDNDNFSMLANVSETPNVNEIPEPEAGPSVSRPLEGEDATASPSHPSDNPPDSDDDDTVHSSSEEPIQGIPITEKALNIFKHQIILDFVYHSPAKTKIENLFSTKRRIYCQLSVNNLESDTIKLFKNYIKPNTIYAINFKNDEYVPKICEFLRNTFKNSAFKLIKCNTVLKDVEDKERQQELIKFLHETKTNHRGILETENRIKQTYYWPGIKTDVSNYINFCDICQVNKYDRNPPKQKLMLTPTPIKPFEIIHIDTFQTQGQKFLTLIDTFSKYAQAYPLISLSGIEVVRSLLTFMTHHGAPTTIVMDNGSELKNSVVQEFLKLHQIHPHYITVNNSQSNGSIERLHSTLIELLRIIKEKDKNSTNILNQMPYAILSYNNSIHSATKQKPIDVINGHLNTKDPLNIDINEKFINNYIENHRDKTLEIYKNLNENLAKKKQATIEKHNEKRHEPLTYKPGTTIYRKITSNNRNKLTPKFSKDQVIQNRKIKITTHRKTLHKQNLRRPKTKQNESLQDEPNRNSDDSRSEDNNN